MKPLFFGLAFGVALSAPSHAQTAPESTPFAFVLPWDDATKTVVDVSALNPAPLDETRRLSVRDGHFRDATNRRVRFIGTNITAGAAFPRREDAAKIAARLHKFGFNCVRLHHMDAPWAKPNIFYAQDGSYGKSTQQISPESMERLDWFVYQLKQHGIYVDLNLHVTRRWSAEDGFPDAEAIDQQGKVVAYFQPRAIQLQKDYARQILNHVNPYTKQSYARDPVVALIEMNNEDSLLGQADAVRGLPVSYRGILQSGWNGWLKARYGDTKTLLAKWNVEARPLGDEMLKNNRFAEEPAQWTVEQHDQTAAQLSTTSAAGATNAPEGRVLKWEAAKTDGTGWHLQLHYNGLNLQDGALYTVSFAARASTQRTVDFNARYDIAPWNMAGLSTQVALDTNWKRFSLSFRADNPLPDHTRLSFGLGQSEGEVFIGDVSLRSGGGGIDLSGGQSIESANLDLPSLNDTAPGRDYGAFLMRVESDYTQQMKAEIRATGSMAPVLCSQASYGGLGGVRRESFLDIIDMHAYWQHPNFPHQAWDSNDYIIPNTSMLREQNGGTLGGLAMHRVEGKPFIVTEYDHPAPNEYAAEEIPLIFAYAAAQDWDGLFLFAYGGDDEEYARTKINGFFDVASHPAKMGFLPAAAQMFLRGYIGRSPQAQTLTIPTAMIEPLVAARTDYSFWTTALKAQKIEVKGRDFFAYRSALRFDDQATQAKLERSEETATGAAPSTLQWNHDAGREHLTIQAPGAVGALGFIGGQSTLAGKMTIAAAPSARNFASVLLSAMDGKPIETSQSLLLTAIDKAENPGLQWNEKRDFAANSWSNGPVEAFGVQAQISLMTRAKAATVWALDATGKKNASVPCQLQNGKLSFTISPADKTIWYQIEAK